MSTLSKLRICGASVAIAGAAVLFTGGLVHAASQPGNTIEETAGCTTVNEGASCQFTFHSTLANGGDDSGDPVHFTLSGVGGTLNPTDSVTDPGFVSTTFTASRTSCGTATITATAHNTGATGTATTTVPCGSAAPLPNTSSGAPPAPLWPAGLGGLAVLTLIGGGVYLRRTRATS